VEGRALNARRHDAIFFVALLSTALALGAALAHALELPNKIAMSRDAYFTVQSIYAGWNRLGLLLAVELASILGLLAVSRRHPRVWWPTLAALVCLVGAQAAFWLFTFPANAATSNWTLVPEEWESLRRRWEYSHLAGAGFQVLAMSALIVAALARTRD
jgi:hypothetical protein